MDVRKIFGDNIRYYRLKKGYTQEKLAELAELGDKSISPIETGRSFIALDKMEKFCEILEVEPYQLFITNDISENISDDLLRERVLSRLKLCNRKELELLCDVLNKFIGK